MKFFFAWFVKEGRVRYRWTVENDAGRYWLRRHHWRHWGVTRFFWTDSFGRHWSSGQFSIRLGPIRIERMALP